MTHSVKFLIAIFVLVGVGGLWMMRTAGWDGKSRFTVIDTRSGVSVASFDPRTEEGTKIIFPKNWMIVGPGGKGEWLADKAGRADLVAENLGILYTTSKLDMKLRDRLLWWWWDRRIKWRQIEGERWMKKEKTVDGMEVWKLDETWNSAAREMLVSAAILEEGLAVTVVNATDEPGLAERVARKIENAGMRVVATQTGETKMQGCQVVSGKQSKAKIGVKLLVKTLGCTWKEAEIGEREVELFFGSQR